MQKEYIKVKDHPNLVRDKRSNAIINIDDDGYNKYKKEREKILKEKEEYENMKSDIADIKKLLQTLLEKK